MDKKYKILSSLFLITLIILAFAPSLNPPAGGWTQQFMPNLGGRNIMDITFVDSLTGFAITSYANDTSFILKTTDGGDNWFYSHSDTGIAYYNRIQFVNQNTGFVGGYIDRRYIVKTTNAGTNWIYISAPYDQIASDMSLINQDSIWIADGSFIGGVFRTTNGGMNWDTQFSGGSQNPDRIYMFNGRIGFISNNSSLPNIYKTTNSGVNWTINLGGEFFTDIHFTDSLTGWKCMPSYDTDSSVKKTTNGGINWIKQRLPQGGMLITSQVYKFGFINKDTIWGSGGQIFYGSGQFRGVLYRTINGGNNWLFQVPDTSLHIQGYGPVQFITSKTGWAYSSQSGIHTTNGGNDTFYTGIQLISSKIPHQFKLYQNYPNPFNPRTVISYELRVTSYVELSVYDITGKLIIVLVNQKQSAGTYQVDFSGNGLSSGVYFYNIHIKAGKEVFTDTKKMILLK